MEGYPKFAHWMSRQPETAIFRSFSKLSAQSLLYQQAELVYLEADLQRIALADKNSNIPHKKSYERNWWALSRSAEDGSDLQLQVATKASKKLKGYHEALFRHEKLQSLDKPNERNVKFLRNWLDDPRKGKSFPEDLEKDIWDETNKCELVSLCRGSQENDVFSKWIKETLLHWFHRRIGYRFKKPVSFDPESGASNYEDKTIQNAVHFIALTVSCLFLILPMLILYLVSNTWARLGIVAIFILLTTFSLAIFTTALRLNIVTTVATYAAVQIFFISAFPGTGK